MLSRLACTKTFISPALLKSAIQNVPRRQVLRNFAEDAKFKTRAERINERMSLKERAMAPPGEDATNDSSQHLHQLSSFKVQMHSPSAKELSPEDQQSGWALYAFMDSAWDPAPTLFRTHSMTRLSPDDCASNNFNCVLVYGRSMLSNESRILTCTSVRVLESRPAVQLPFSAARPC